MSNVPTELRYAKSHEWLKTGADGTATVGISDHAQNSLGDITYVQLPKIGAELKAGEPFGVVESVKAASDLYAPVGGAVIAVNTALDKAPETINSRPLWRRLDIEAQAIEPGRGCPPSGRSRLREAGRRGLRNRLPPAGVTRIARHGPACAGRPASGPFCAGGATWASPRRIRRSRCIRSRARAKASSGA